ncbi:MAG: hypothetical protein VCE74_12915 [Alphaproteobacteria bacterium]|jgi:hypothetical protein
MPGTFSAILSKIKSALLHAAARRPTHFLAIGTAQAAKDEPIQGEGTAKKDKNGGVQ